MFIKYDVLHEYQVAGQEWKIGGGNIFYLWKESQYRQEKRGNICDQRSGEILQLKRKLLLMSSLHRNKTRSFY